MREPVERRGNAVSPGLGIGPAYVVDRKLVNVPRTHIEREQVDDEIKRFRAALRTAHEQLEVIKGRLTHGEHRQILKAQQLMLRDPDLIQRTEGLIRDELINAEWAVSRIVEEIRQMLAKVADDYLRERQFDVAFMGERLIMTLGGEEKDAITPPEGSVVVAYDLSPADTAQLHRYKVAGIVTEEGGQTSHTAIMARALQIPAVVGVDDLRIERGGRAETKRFLPAIERQRVSIFEPDLARVPKGFLREVVVRPVIEHVAVLIDLDERSSAVGCRPLEDALELLRIFVYRARDEGGMGREGERKR
ncbi:MAG: hypothetical protein HC923_09895 [Myxococcales bacterium]|nr:hypothetical protein [Myxococcales bacterium]